MKLTFRQGLVSYQPNFLSFNGSTVVLSTTNKPAIATLVVGNFDFLLIEPVTSPKSCWLNVPASDCWLYWNVDLVTGLRSYGITLNQPIYSGSIPNNPVVDQHWFDMTSTTMKVWDGARWVMRARVFAAKVSNGAIIEPFALQSSQAGLYQPIRSGVILYDDAGKAITRNDGTFLTSESGLFLEGPIAYTASVNAYTSYNFATQSLPRFSVGKLITGNQVALAAYEDITSSVLVLVLGDVASGDPVSVTYDGIISNANWNWNVGDMLWINDTGTFTNIDQSNIGGVIRPEQPPIARALAVDTIIFAPTHNLGTGPITQTGQQVTINDASTTVKGITLLTVPPIVATSP